MGWLTSPAATKEVGAAAFSNQPFGLPGNDPDYPEPSFGTFASFGFSKNELVYACITEKASSLPEAPLCVFPGDGSGAPRENHPLRVLLANPNPLMSEFELFELLVIHLDLAGNAFWEVVRDRADRPVELWPLRPDRVRIYPSRKGRITYGYDLGSDRVVDLGSDVIHFKLPNPVDPYVGQAPMRPALRAVALDNEATDFVKTLLQNRAVPGTLIETEYAVDEEVTKRLTAKWMERFGGNNRGKPGFLQKGMKPHPLGLNLSDLEFPDLRTISESRICMVFQVPPILIGAKVGLDRSTFANYAEARRSFWEETLMPLQKRIAQTVARQLLPMVEQSPRPRRVVVRFDNSEVLALRESEGKRWELATQALRAGGITRRRFALQVGLPDPGETADVYLQPAGVAQVDAGGRVIAPAPSDATGPADPAADPADPADDGAKLWELLAPNHPDFLKQCPTCRVVWDSEVKADACTEHHHRDYLIPDEGN